MECGDTVPSPENMQEYPDSDIETVQLTPALSSGIQLCSNRNSAGVLALNGVNLSPTGQQAVALVRDVSPVRLGYTGLLNEGNLCFANAVLQSLINTRELKEYFTKNYHLQDLRVDKSGDQTSRLAVVFSKFVKAMWRGKSVVRASIIVKLLNSNTISFADGHQHDAQEFLSFLLDELHEQLSRKHENVTAEPLQTGQTDDSLLAQHAWDNYNRTNDSILVDIFHGLVCSRLLCLICGKASVTCDPFVFVPVPFPKPHKVEKVYYWPAKFDEAPILVRPSRYLCSGACVDDLLCDLAEMFHVSDSLLIAVRVLRGQIVRFYNRCDRIFAGSQEGSIFVFERLNKEDHDDNVFNIFVVQCVPLMSKCSVPENCSTCSKLIGNNGGITYSSYATNRYDRGNGIDPALLVPACPECSLPTVGAPFMVSIRRDECTVNNLRRVLEHRSSFSVSIYKLMNEADDADWSDDSDDIAEVLGPDNVIDLTYSLDEEDRVFEEGIVINRSGPQDGAFRKLSEDTPNSSPAFSDKSDGDKYSCTPIDFRYGRQMNERPSFFIYIWSSNDYVYEDQLEAAGDRHVSFLATDYLAMYWRISVDGSPSLRVETKDRIDCIDICSKSNCGAFNLVDMLRYFTEAEVLTDDNSWHCNRCCKRQASTKTLSFWKLPPLLIVQIKRFSYISYEDSPCYAKQKIEVPVRYPLKDFDMKPFLSPGAPDQSTKYDLYAVVSHVGSCFFGHYVARARLLAKCGSGSEVGWRYFNDDDVCDQPHMNDEDPDAYFLFYARQNYCVDELLKSYKDQCVEMDGSDSDTDFGNEANPVIVDDIPGSSC